MRSDLLWFRILCKHFVCSRQNFQVITQNYQFKPSNKLEKSFVCSGNQNGIYIPNWLLFSSCLAIANVSNKQYLLDKAFCWFPAFPGFHFFATDHIWKPGNHGRFQFVIFQRGECFMSYYQNFVNHSVWFGERCQSIAQSYQCKQRIESWNSCAHLRWQTVLTYQVAYF